MSRGEMSPTGQPGFIDRVKQHAAEYALAGGLGAVGLVGGVLVATHESNPDTVPGWALACNTETGKVTNPSAFADGVASSHVEAVAYDNSATYTAEAGGDLVDANGNALDPSKGYNLKWTTLTGENHIASLAANQLNCKQTDKQTTTTVRAIQTTTTSIAPTTTTRVPLTTPTTMKGITGTVVRGTSATVAPSSSTTEARTEGAPSNA